MIEEVKKDTTVAATEKTLKSHFQKLKDWTNSGSELKQIAIRGLATIVMANGIEAATGWKPQVRYLALVFGGPFKGVGASSAAGEFEKLASKIHTAVLRRKYQNLPTPQAKFLYGQELKKKGVSGPKLKKIRAR
jgi:hypothetical protein